MSPKIKVSNLTNLALKLLVQQVTFALSDDEGLHYEEICDYYKYAPPEIVEDILKIILRTESLDAGTRFNCLEVLLKNNVKFLETGIFPQFYYERILQVLISQGSGLQHLSLKGVWLKDNPDLLCLALNQMDQLKVLHIPHIADDIVLKTITKLTNLKVLNVSGECNFTKEGLDQFCQCIKNKNWGLKVLDIGSNGEENVPHEIVAELILNLKHLATLKSYSFVGKSLLYLYKKDKYWTCNLKHIHDTKTTLEICEAVQKTCPFLENLYFDSPENGVVGNIKKITGLNSLKLVKFQCSDVHKLLEKWGECLHTLKLSLGRGILDMSKVAQDCPNVQKIEFYKMEFISHTTDPPIYKLQNLEVHYTELTTSCLRYILNRAPELKKIIIGDEVGITDGDLYRLCADFCLLSLEELWFINARYLTVNTIELLMGHCPYLRLLGRVTGWNLTRDDTDFIKAVAQSTNSDFVLLPVDMYE